MPGRAAPAKGKTAAAKRTGAANQGSDTVKGKAKGSADPNAILVEHTPSGQLVAQRGLFAGPSPLVSNDLYAEVISGVARRDRDRVTIEPSALVSMNTYFGRFPASYWQRWTVVREVAVE